MNNDKQKELDNQNLNDVSGTTDDIIKLQLEITNLKMLLETTENDKIRALADWDNARKQYDNDLKEVRKYRSQAMIVQLLPIMDNFERALNVKNVGADVKNFLQGFEMMINQLKVILTNEGVTEIDVKVGDMFNSHLHYAIEQVESDKYQPNEITKILQKGYHLYNRVLRVATVQVAKEKMINNNEENQENIEMKEEK
ncbi:nucleotide exchange factor GrpE [Spiroplasma endosymbiont of Nephrotoma flavescens]|uniref:nucleotide exchange factor GrpE n=1 Tax=Spiroplasma endosymbiont of Nephrotoma flavescens TaxID=3066302 RepID=UPI00313AFFAA